MRFVGATTTLHPDALTTLDVQFGRLTKDRFDALVAAFGSRPRPIHRPSRSYELLDFLPPVVRALVELDIEVPPPQPLPGSTGWNPRAPETPLSVTLDPNCHGTAFEVLSHLERPRSEVRIHHGEMLTMDGFVHGPGFERVGGLPSSRIGRIASLGLRCGDLVQFHEESEWPRSTFLLHSAVHLGAGVYFDKPNTEGPGEDTPYRIGTFTTVSRPVLHAVEGRVRVEVLRRVAPLPHATTVFASDFADRLARLERARRRPIGAQIVHLYEHGVGGGITQEHLSALVEVPVTALPPRAHAPLAGR